MRCGKKKRRAKKSGNHYDKLLAGPGYVKKIPTRAESITKLFIELMETDESAKDFARKFSFQVGYLEKHIEDLETSRKKVPRF